MLLESLLKLFDFGDLLKIVILATKATAMADRLYFVFIKSGNRFFHPTTMTSIFYPIAINESVNEIQFKSVSLSNKKIKLF